MDNIKVKSALISVFSKEGLDTIIEELINNDIKLYSTGGTHDYISRLGYNVTKVESLTEYPSIFGGRVKTLHPKIFGGILFRRDNNDDIHDDDDDKDDNDDDDDVDRLMLGRCTN